MAYLTLRQAKGDDEIMVKAISADEFESFDHSATPQRFTLAEEVEWFKTDTESAIAVLFRDRTDNDYGFSILIKDSKGQYQFENVEHSIESQAEARKQLLDVLERC